MRSIGLKEFIWFVEAVKLELCLLRFCKEANGMGRRIQTDIVWTEVELEHEEDSCSECGRQMHVKKTKGQALAWTT
jgi:hypothetical protein